MPRLVYRPSADDNLEEIFDYFARDTIARALSFTDELRHQCRRLAGLPGTLGTPRPRLDRDIRSFTYKGYVILFRYVGDTLEVVNIIEGHRDIDSLFL
jgi:plasmid stabilization system protein ParE